VGLISPSFMMLPAVGGFGFCVVRFAHASLAARTRGRRVVCTLKGEHAPGCTRCVAVAPSGFLSAEGQAAITIPMPQDHWLPASTSTSRNGMRRGRLMRGDLPLARTGPRDIRSRGRREARRPGHDPQPHPRGTRRATDEVLNVRGAFFV
jgi:hypothetical protein